MTAGISTLPVSPFCPSLFLFYFNNKIIKVLKSKFAGRDCDQICLENMLRVTTKKIVNVKPKMRLFFT